MESGFATPENSLTAALQNWKLRIFMKKKSRFLKTFEKLPRKVISGKLKVFSSYI